MKYIAITLGPITRTIEMAESTKELWAASYFFSYLAKEIVELHGGRIYAESDMKETTFSVILPIIEQA